MTDLDINRRRLLGGVTDTGIAAYLRLGYAAGNSVRKHAGEPASSGFARWVYVVLHCFRVEDDHSHQQHRTLV